MNSTKASQLDDDAWLVVGRSTRIPKSELTFTFVRSSGPGGQNVNKVASKACLRWPVVESPSLDEAVKQRLLSKYRRRISVDGDLLLTSQRTRDQSRNIADCLEKLRAIIQDVLTPPARRKRTKPSRGARERRLKAKRQRATTKESRRPPRRDE